MSARILDRPATSPDSFRHDALVYRGEDEFVDAISSFVLDGLEADEPVLVVVSARKIALLQARLGAAAAAVCFTDMAELGRNPARIIPAWREFVDKQTDGGNPPRGVGEPIFPERTPAEVAECQRHEVLLNVAFGGTPAWWLLCPYDLETLNPAIIHEARRSHPYISEAGQEVVSPDYVAGTNPVLDDPLSEPPVGTFEMDFDVASPLQHLRHAVSVFASETGITAGRTADLVLAVNELATNSLRHGGGRGILRIWSDTENVICEVRDQGRIGELLIGRERPARLQDGGRGLWLVNQLCDLVQLRTQPAGSVVRLYMSRPG